MIQSGDSVESRWKWWVRLAASAIIVMGLHAGLVAYAYFMPPPEDSVEEAQGAFMMELAPLPVAAASESAELGPVEETTQPQIVEKTPTETVPEEVTPPKEDPLPVAPDPELAMPIPKPVDEPKEEKEDEEPPVEKKEVVEEKKKEEEKPEVEKAKPQEAMVQQSLPPSAAATPAPKAAAQRQGTTDRRSDEALTWARALMNHLSKHRRYPTAARNAGQEGTVKVRFRIDRNGKVLMAEVVDKSRSPLLDKEAVDMVQRASPLPAPPGEVGGETIERLIPIVFTLK